MRIHTEGSGGTRFLSQPRGTMILAELPNSLAIAVTSDMWRVERLFNNIPLLTCLIIHSYNHPQLYTLRLVVPVRLYNRIMEVLWYNHVI
jgi:hypothetical protein